MCQALESLVRAEHVPTARLQPPAPRLDGLYLALDELAELL